MIDLPLLLPFLPEVGAVLLAIALIAAAGTIANKVGDTGQSGFLKALTAPLQVISSGVHSALNAASQALLDAHAPKIVSLLAGTAESLQNLIFYPARLFAGVHAALTYLWNTAIPQYVRAQLSPITTEISNLAGRLTADVAGLRSSISSALSQAEGYTDAGVRDVRSYVDSRVVNALAQAEAYADEAVSKLRSAEDTAVAQAVSIATTAERDAAAAFDQAKAYAGQLVAPVAGDLTALEDYIKSLGIPAIAAGAVATAALLTQALADTGLENADCRSKVKGICGTDPTRWLGLLEGIAALGLAFDLRALVKVANEIAPAATAIVKTAA
jgi:hypothetical protein